MAGWTATDRNRGGRNGCGLDDEHRFFFVTGLSPPCPVAPFDLVSSVFIAKISSVCQMILFPPYLQQLAAV